MTDQKKIHRANVIQAIALLATKRRQCMGSDELYAWLTLNNAIDYLCLQTDTLTKFKDSYGPDEEEEVEEEAA